MDNNALSLKDSQNKIQEFQKEYIAELEKTPKYSLAVDPENKYNMTDEQKQFVRMYVEYKSIPAVAEFMGLDLETARQYYLAYSSQQEIRRINLALYQRQFATRLLDLDEISGYLSSLLLDLNVPEADRLKTKDKLHVAQMMIDLHKLKAESFNNPQVLMTKDLDSQIKELSITTIQHLLGSLDNTKKKNNIIYNVTGTEVLTPEETAYLSTLPTSDLLDLVQQTAEEDNKNGNK